MYNYHSKLNLVRMIEEGIILMVTFLLYDVQETVCLLR